ncbi:MAG: hypothetical protein FJW20_21530 [Acidimicrobiia bacterium]|nr:hypothetical protein [Acidimicrobiia bacterium]
MNERLYLSFWLNGYTEHNMLRHFEKALWCFPFSRLRGEAILRIHALEFAEPPILERLFERETTAQDLVEAAREFQHADCAYQLECWWDIWQLEQEWKLQPCRVIVTCFGPLFESEWGEQIQFEFGVHSQFLPAATDAGSMTALRSNIRSLLHLAEEIEERIPVSKRTLWSESGENLAEQLQNALGGLSPHRE